MDFIYLKKKRVARCFSLIFYFSHPKIPTSSFFFFEKKNNFIDSNKQYIIENI